MAIARITMGLIATWMVAWTPYALVALAGISGYAHLITVFIHVFNLSRDAEWGKRKVYLYISYVACRDSALIIA